MPINLGGLVGRLAIYVMLFVGISSLNFGYLHASGVQMAATEKTMTEVNAAFQRRDIQTALRLMQQGCDAGDGEICRLLASLYTYGPQTGSTIPNDDKRAIILLTKSCDVGTLSGCYDLAERYNTGKGIREDKARSAAIYSKLCEDGYSFGCFEIGVLSHNGEGVSQDQARAIDFFSKACNEKDLVCNDLARSHQSGEFKKKQNIKTIGNYEIRCNFQDHRSCLIIGFFYENAVMVRKDAIRAAIFYTKACNGGSAIGCDSANRLSKASQMNVHDGESLSKIYGDMCRKEDINGCLVLALLYENGEDVPRDKATAAEIYSNACNKKILIGCTYLADMYKTGQGVNQDKPRALVLYSNACDSGEHEACRELGIMYSIGDAVSKDAVRATMLFQKGCVARHIMSCFAIYVDNLGKGDKASNIDILTKICDAATGLGCDALADAYLKGDGVERDPKRAALIQQRSGVFRSDLENWQKR